VIGVGYALPAVLAALAVVALERFVLRTGLFGKASYWLSMVIVLGFQIPVDGWLTKLNDPIVQYAPEHLIGVRAPWDIPVEDFAFGFAMVTAVLLLWEKQRPAADREQKSGQERLATNPENEERR
jgi:lycopene cyclase domain-containing protein